MNKNEDFLLELRNIINITDLENLIKKLKLPSGTKLDEELLLIKSSHKEYSKSKDNLNNLLKLAFRIYIFCKTSGYMAIKPNNSGESSFFSKLKLMLKSIEIVSNNEITSMSDITNTMIKDSIAYMFKKGQTIRTIKMKINALRSVVNEHDKFPDLLKINPSVIKGINSSYIEMEEKKFRTIVSDNILNNHNGIITNRKQYELESMKILVSKSKEIYNHKDELLEVLKIMVSAKMESTSPDKRAKYVFNKFKDKYSIGENFKFEIIKKWQLRFSVTDKFYMYDSSGTFKGRKIVGGLYRDILKATEILEGACIILALIGTAMRSSEFLNLSNKVKFTEGEHPGIVRTIFKTTILEDGEDYNNPIPRLSKDVIETLVEISDIKYGKANKYLLSPSILINTKSYNGIRNSRLNQLIKHVGIYANLSSSPTSHDFRHIMAYLIASSNTTYGLEMASMLLGHKDLKMTINYLARFNKDMEDALTEINKINSGKLIDKICEKIEKKERIFGVRAELLMPDISFVGKVTEKFTLSLNRELRDLVNEEKIAIVQTAHCMCIHDLSNPRDMKCQLNFNIKNLAIGSNPYVARCKGAECKNSVFFEEDIEILEKLYGHLDKSIKDRLERNTYIMAVGGIDNIIPNQKLIKEYKEYKENKEKYK